jgi:hypothetical protein
LLIAICFPDGILEAISKMPFGPISASGSRFKSSTYLRMRVEDPDGRRGGLKPGPAFLSRRVSAGDLEPKSCFFEMVSILLKLYIAL